MRPLFLTGFMFCLLNNRHARCVRLRIALQSDGVRTRARICVVDCLRAGARATARAARRIAISIAPCDVVIAGRERIIKRERNRFRIAADAGRNARRIVRRRRAAACAARINDYRSDDGPACAGLSLVQGRGVRTIRCVRVRQTVALCAAL